MSRTALNFLLDAILLTITLALLFTSAVLRFVFPRPGEAAGWVLWGHDFDAWTNFQFALLTLIALAVLLHIMLHWSWVCGVVVTRILKNGGARAKRDDGAQTLYGVGMLIVVLNLLGALVGLAYLMIQPPPT